MSQSIAVILPIYKEPLEWIEEAVGGIRAQTVLPCKIIVGIDGERADVSAIERILIGTGISYVIKMARNNQGLTKILNNLIEIVEEDYIFRLDADDIYEPHHIERSLLRLKTDGVHFVSTAFWICNSEGQRICKRVRGDDGFLGLADFANRNILCHGALSCKTHILRLIGGYDECCKKGQDYRLYYKILTSNLGLYYLNSPTYRLRVNLSSVSVSGAADQRRESLKTRNMIRERLGLGSVQDSEAFTKSLAFSRGLYAKSINGESGLIMRAALHEINYLQSPRVIAFKLALLVRALLVSLHPRLMHKIFY